MIRLGMSAGEARAEGHAVPGHVPDCASLEINPFAEQTFTDVAVIQGDIDSRLPTMRFSVATLWRWVSVNGVIDDR